MSRRSSRGVLVLPTHVRDATSILPIARGDREFEEFILHVRRGHAVITCGEPIRWEDLQPNEQEIEAALSTHGDEAKKHLIHAKTMRAIAALAPDHLRGAWS